jgi:hypothetical protein
MYTSRATNLYKRDTAASNASVLPSKIGKNTTDGIIELRVGAKK